MASGALSRSASLRRCSEGQCCLAAILAVPPAHLTTHCPRTPAIPQPLRLDWDSFDIRLRMTVARLPDSSLLLVSPVAPTPECLRLLGTLGGDVRHIVLPSSAPEHWFYGPKLSAAFPAATVWTVPGLLEGKGLPLPFFGAIIASMRPRCKTLGADPLPEELQGELEAAVLQAPFFNEAALVLPRYRALLLADTGAQGRGAPRGVWQTARAGHAHTAAAAPSALGRPRPTPRPLRAGFCMRADEYGHLGAGSIKAAQQVGVWDRLGPITRIVFDKFPDQGRAWVAAVQEYDYDVVIPAHASAPVADGKAAFSDCFSFLS